MATRKTSAQETGDGPGQDVLTGYQMAIALWTHERALNWGRFNVMLIVNAIIITVLAATFSGSSAEVPALILCVVGLVLSAVWFALTRRGFEVQNYYVKSAREIEENYLAEGLRTVSRGGAFAEGKPVSMLIGGKDTTVQLGAIGGLFSAETGAQVVIGLFVGLYVLLALLTAVQMVRQVF